MNRTSCYTIACDPVPGTFEVRLRGEIDLARKAELHELIAAYARSMTGDALVDLGEVTFFDVTGLAFLLDLRRECRIRGGHFTLTRVPSLTRRVVEIAGMGALLTAERAGGHSGG
jgi:anti-anti-sigma factor